MRHTQQTWRRVEVAKPKPVPEKDARYLDGLIEDSKAGALSDSDFRISYMEKLTELLSKGFDTKPYWKKYKAYNQGGSQ